MEAYNQFIENCKKVDAESILFKEEKKGSL